MPDTTSKTTNPDEAAEIMERIIKHQTAVMRTAACAARRGSAEDGMRVIYQELLEVGAMPLRGECAQIMEDAE